MLSLVSLSLFAIAAPLPAPKTPSGPPPRVEIVQVGEDGRPFLRGKPVEKFGRSLVHERVPVTVVGKDGKQQTVYKTVAKDVPFSYYEYEAVYLDTKKLQIFGLDGKRLDPAEVRKHLARPVAVFVSADGKPIDPIFLKLLREGSLWVVAPELAPPANLPQQESLPQPKPRP